MKVVLTKPAQKSIAKLPYKIRVKAAKQVVLLQKNPSHPSLRIKKQSGIKYYEVRIDYRYRITFRWAKNIATIIAIGMHDTGLGKK
jgi:mRNA-degrading endonuclease RelE of RelBE toxin-antitoxin system